MVMSEDMVPSLLCSAWPAVIFCCTALAIDTSQNVVFAFEANAFFVRDSKDTFVHLVLLACSVNSARNAKTGERGKVTVLGTKMSGDMHDKAIEKSG